MGGYWRRERVRQSECHVKEAFLPQQPNFARGRALVLGRKARPSLSNRPVSWIPRSCKTPRMSDPIDSQTFPKRCARSIDNLDERKALG